MDTPKYGAFWSSSVDQQKLAATAEGLIATLGSAALFFGFLDAATETTLMAHVNALITDATVLVPLVVSMSGLCYTIFGLLRKGIVAWLSAKKTAPLIQAQEPNLG